MYHKLMKAHKKIGSPRWFNAFFNLNIIDLCSSLFVFMIIQIKAKNPWLPLMCSTSVGNKIDLRIIFHFNLPIRNYPGQNVKWTFFSWLNLHQVSPFLKLTKLVLSFLSESLRKFLSILKKKEKYFMLHRAC
jgi:hypothetical protein